MTVADLYPISLRLLGRPVLVVGGGEVGARRARGLLDAGAVVTVVDPSPGERVAALAEAGLLTLRRRPWRPADLEDVWLVHTATGRPEVDDAVAAAAEDRRLWCVHAGDAAASSAWVPAVARVGEVTVAVNADGDPARARAVKASVAAGLVSAGAPLRRRRRPDGPGRVALVGGGPGDEELITVRGRRLLAEADVVVADRLGPRGLLEDLDPEVRIVEVGKAPGRHPVPQERIEQILVAEARAGHRVVRLKGGDPYVLGRGGEEAATLRAHGVEVEVVPGVTSAVSVPAAAGIPVTHRGLATGFTVVTGHEELGTVPVRPDHTLVLLMGVRRLRSIASTLLGRGLPPDTPAAVVERGWTPEQRVTLGTAATIADRAEAVGAANPAVIVVGDVVRLSPVLAEARAADRTDRPNDLAAVSAADEGAGA